MNENEKAALNIERLTKAARGVIEGFKKIEGDVGTIRYTVPKRTVDRLAAALSEVERNK